MALRGHFFHVPVELAQTPIDGETICNKWWTVHPEKGLLFYLSSLRMYVEGEKNSPAPQCNHNESVAKRLSVRLHPECETKFLPVVFAGHARKIQAEMLKASSAK